MANNLNGWFDVIKNLKLGHAAVHYNTECLKCNNVFKYMVRVGVLVFCDNCFKEEFKSSDPVREEREKYKHWLHFQTEKVNQEIEEENK